MAVERLLASIALCAAPAFASAPNPAARDVALSSPDCAGPENIIAEDASAPRNATFLRVQHIGDPGTEELAREVANVVTWKVSAVSGLDAPTVSQRGYRDMGLPTGTSAFQLDCGAAGFLINTWQFNHASPLVGEGPSASIARQLDPGAQPFVDAASTLVLTANMKLPWSYSETAPTAEGTAQLSFFYYAQDNRSGIVFAHLIELFDNRAAGVGGAGVEYTGSDGVTAFVSSPMLTLDSSGAAVRYVRPVSGTMSFAKPWGDSAYFRAEIPYDNFRAMLTRLKSESFPALSTDPIDYRILLFGVLAEAFPGTGSDHNVSIGGSVADLTLAAARPRPRFPR